MDQDLGAESRSSKLRSAFARLVVQRAEVGDARIRRAFAAVPREPFAGPAPWFIVPSGAQRDGPRYLRTRDDDPALLYRDVLIALDPVRGINIGEPSLHARCLDALAVPTGASVVQIGAGSGYYTAILAELVGAAGEVFGFEIDADLAARAERNLRPWPWATVEARSGTSGQLPEADAIYVNAGTTQPSWLWLDALKPGGRLLFPLQQEGGWGGMLLMRKPIAGGTVWPARFVCRATFIALQGRQSDEMGRRLAVAFASGGWEGVRSIHLNDRPDKTCWLKGGDWWLSTHEP